jgi:DNA-binding transcriptional MerR regulator
MKNIEVVLQSQIERKSGLGIEQLRKWRQRYGFPPAQLGTAGLAVYSIETVDKLVLIRRLLEAGFKPSEVVQKSSDDLKKLILDISDHRPAAKRSELTQKLIEILKQSDIEEFHSILKNDRAQKTMLDFCQNTIAPLMISIGDAWANNEIDVYHEHLCTTIVERFLIGETLKNNPKISYPIFLFALPPKEFHQLGLLMVESIIAEHGAWIINIGADVPLFSLKLAAISTKADVVAISFSFAYPKRDVLPVLKHIRRLLPASIQLWAGGSGLRFLRRTPKGIRSIPDLSGIVSSFLDLKPVH